MSGLEIERKFLVKKGDAYKSAAFSDSHIQQGYIPAQGATVRVRTRDDKAYLTIKGKSVNGGMPRYAIMSLRSTSSMATTWDWSWQRWNWAVRMRPTRSPAS